MYVIPSVLYLFPPLMLYTRSHSVLCIINNSTIITISSVVETLRKENFKSDYMQHLLEPQKAV